MTISRYDGIVDDDEPFWDEESWRWICERGGQIEFDWFGVDRNGFLGAFASFGTGPFPEAVTTSREHFNRLILAVARLQNSGAVVYHQPIIGDRSTWGVYAKRGLYAFDNSESHGQAPRRHYHPIAWSERPLHLKASEIPSELHGVLPLIDVEFGPDLVVPFDKIPP